MPPAPPTIDELLARAKAGDAAGRNELLAACRSYLGFLARAQVETWLRRKVDASDLVQQTMLDAHCGLEQFQGASEREFLAWLKQILQHNAADFVRRYAATAKRDAAREVPFADPADSLARGVPEPAAADATPSQELLRIDSELRVAAALAALPADYQEVIVLRNLQRLPFNEVGERMGRTRPAAQMLWMRAIRKLQEALGPEE